MLVRLFDIFTKTNTVEFLFEKVDLEFECETFLVEVADVL